MFFSGRNTSIRESRERKKEELFGSSINGRNPILSTIEDQKTDIQFQMASLKRKKNKLTNKIRHISASGQIPSEIHVDSMIEYEEELDRLEIEKEDLMNLLNVAKEQDRSNLRTNLYEHMALRQMGLPQDIYSLDSDEFNEIIDHTKHKTTRKHHVSTVLEVLEDQQEELNDEMKEKMEEKRKTTTEIMEEKKNQRDIRKKQLMDGFLEKQREQNDIMKQLQNLTSYPQSSTTLDSQLINKFPEVPKNKPLL